MRKFKNKFNFFTLMPLALAPIALSVSCQAKTVLPIQDVIDKTKLGVIYLEDLTDKTTKTVSENSHTAATAAKEINFVLLYKNIQNEFVNFQTIFDHAEFAVTYQIDKTSLDDENGLLSVVVRITRVATKESIVSDPFKVEGFKKSSTQGDLQAQIDSIERAYLREASRILPSEAVKLDLAHFAFFKQNVQDEWRPDWKQLNAEVAFPENAANDETGELNVTLVLTNKTDPTKMVQKTFAISNVAQTTDQRRRDTAIKVIEEMLANMRYLALKSEAEKKPSERNHSLLLASDVRADDLVVQNSSQMGEIELPTSATSDKVNVTKQLVQVENQPEGTVNLKLTASYNGIEESKILSLDGFMTDLTRTKDLLDNEIATIKQIDWIVQGKNKAETTVTDATQRNNFASELVLYTDDEKQNVYHFPALQNSRVRYKILILNNVKASSRGSVNVNFAFIQEEDKDETPVETVRSKSVFKQITGFKAEKITISSN
ncbi:lipoprotein 17-related variable surface protein [Mycoplasmopsis columbinasalis]|uniref:Lipoprotein associated domain n=1 Tax=Mycoplasmopsis columbinasalis TaxID=114880 RepID=A0A449BA20_9BACT|nr:lipoprotein 17-related variable surface protein [Mycoplasmopsis columbinasalis]VEU78005.1 Lipoprotein associated domain [Mycoplasmopsis columbinasalis]